MTEPDPPLLDVDTLMARDPLSLSAQDIDQIIAYHRKARARKAAGEKPIKPKIDISAILKAAPKPEAAPLKRRF